MNERKKALITGVTGQIGSYLAELLVDKGYEVYGIVRRSFDTKHVTEKYIPKEVKVIIADLEDLDSIERAIRAVKPDEIYNLASQTNAVVSFDIPEYTFKVNGFSVVRICETIKKMNKPIKIYQPGSAELYGDLSGVKVDEKTLFNPKNSYAIAKLSAYYMMREYREVYDMFCCNGIMFNTESPRRGEGYVTRKITKGVSDVTKGILDKITLGNLDAKRDWLHAKDVANAIWIIIQAEIPGDYVIASGEGYKIREFVELAFKHAGIEIIWKGRGLDEVGLDKRTEKILVNINPKFFRLKDRDITGNSNKLKQLGWERAYNFEDIVKEMVEHDLRK